MNTNRISNLQNLQADYTVLYQKLRTFHWLVRGPHFFTLHEQFEKLYRFTESAIDQIAERIRALGGTPLTTLSDIIERANLQELNELSHTDVMVDTTIDDLESLRQPLKSLVDASYDDAVTQDLLLRLLTEQESFLWMLKAYRSKP